MQKIEWWMISSTAVLWGGTNSGMVGFMTAETPSTRMAVITITAGNDFVFGDAAHLGVAQPLGLFPQTGNGGLFRLHETMKKPHSRKVISQPMGNM
jgi:hypothetical protein